MKTPLLMVMILLAAQNATGKDTVLDPQQPMPQLGMNLSAPCDWNTELPFVDVFRLSRPWISQKRNMPWGKGPLLKLDTNGWIKDLEPDCWAETLICTIDGGHYPSGNYTIFYDGNGRLEVSGAATVASSNSGRMVIKVNAAKGAIFLRLLATDPKNYIRNIRVIMPGFEKTYHKNPFHPIFLRNWRGMACLRFMDWMKTNGSQIRRWSERPTPQSATFSNKGVALEVMLDLCNRMKIDPWFCMPHMADDEYVRNFSAMVKDRLAPDRKVYVEYSNEVWNNIFPQSKYAAQQGTRLGFAKKPWEAGWKYTAHRSLQIFRIWQKDFSPERLVRVLPSQVVNPYVSRQIVEFENAYQHADALAIAPYLSCNIAINSQPSAAEVEKWTVEQALDYLEETALPEAVASIKKQKKIADKYGLKLVAYEGGQHMVGVGGAENIDAITRLFHAANRRKRIGSIYQRYYDAWVANGGDLFCYFASTSRWSKCGSWGILEWFDEDPTDSSKFMSTMLWARHCGQNVNWPE